MNDGSDTTGGRVLETLRGVFLRNVHLKAVALLLTLALYLWVGEDRETRIEATAPLQISVPENQVLLQPKIDQVKVELRGRWAALEQFETDELKPVVVDVTRRDDGELVPITPESVRLPPGLEVVSIEPSFIRVDLATRIEKTVDIEPRIVGRTRKAYTVGDVAVRPARIDASGPEDVMEDLTSIPTEPVDVTGRIRSFQKQVKLRPTSPLVEYDPDVSVTVEVPIEAEKIRRTFRDLGISAVNTTMEVDLRPSETVDLTVRGPRSIVENLDRATLQAVVDLEDAAADEAGTFERKIQIRNLPGELEIVRLQPRHFVVQTRPRAGADAGRPSN